MPSIAATYTHLEDAARGLEELRNFMDPDRIHVLTPASKEDEILAVPTTHDMPPVGRVMGGVLGAALGGGLVVALPGLGQLSLVGAAAAAVIGGILGYRLGDAVDRATFRGMPVDEVFVYEDALRHGRTVLVALAGSSDEEWRAKRIFERTGAESLDAARRSWWLGIRDAETARYERQGLGDFAIDEPLFRKGYEAALSVVFRGRPYEEVAEQLRNLHPSDAAQPAFRIGFERGFETYRERLPGEG